MIVVGVLLGLVAGLLLGVLVTRRRRPAAAPPVPVPADTRPVPPSSVEVIDALPVAVAVLDRDDAVVLANRSAVELGVVRGGRVVVAELRRLVRDVRLTRAPQEVEVELAAARLVRVPEAVRVRLVPVGDLGHVALQPGQVDELLHQPAEA